MIREILASYLIEDRHVVATAADAKEALEKFQRNQFDLVITDQAMPGANGQDVAAFIKTFESAKPMIVLSGFPRPSEAG
jgi:YesN/AraC family two-component response regulator